MIDKEQALQPWQELSADDLIGIMQDLGITVAGPAAEAVVVLASAIDKALREKNGGRNV